VSETKGILGSVVVVAVCCALPALLVTGTGFASAVAGVGMRYWPLALLGLAVFSWGAVRLARLAWARRTRPKTEGTSQKTRRSSSRAGRCGRPGLARTLCVTDRQVVGFPRSLLCARPAAKSLTDQGVRSHRPA
jgi:hypothetical protein